MKYYAKGSKEFIDNGSSKIRVATVQQIPSPNSKDRVLRIFSVQESLKDSPTNLIEVGTLIALSFPPDKANSKEYKWKRGEECQVKFNIQLNGGDHVDGDPEPMKQ